MDFKGGFQRVFRVKRPAVKESLVEYYDFKLLKCFSAFPEWVFLMYLYISLKRKPVWKRLMDFKGGFQRVFRAKRPAAKESLVEYYDFKLLECLKKMDLFSNL